MADEKEKSGRFVRVVLVASLALNLAVAGVVIGSVASGRMGDGPPRSFDLGLGPVARALDPEDRRAVGAELRRTRPMGDFDLRAQIAEMIATLRADQFDPEALRALMTDQNRRIATLQQNAQDALINHIDGMTVQERHAFADRLVAELSRVRDRRSHKSDD